MFVTVRLPIQNTINIIERLRLYNAIVRFSYNRIKDDLNQKEIRAIVKNKFQKSESWFSHNAIIEGKNCFDKNPKVVFGGKHNLLKRQHNKISNEDWKNLRLHPILIQGEKLQHGNRFMILNIEQHNSIQIKFNKNEKFEIELPKLHKTIKKKLIKLEKLSKNKSVSITFKLANKFIYLIYDDRVLQNFRHKLKKENIICGIDMNPTHIGLSISKVNKHNHIVEHIIHKTTFDLTLLNKKDINKKIHETIQICKKIEHLCVQYNCGSFSIEELSIRSKNHERGKSFNKLVNNDWVRRLFYNNMKKRCDNNDIKYIEVNPAYSSTIGNVCFDSVDEINSATEIARRGFCKYIQKLCLYPPLNIMKHQWKDVFVNQNSWKDIHDELKNSKLKYRVPFSDAVVKSHHHLVSRKSQVDYYILE